MVGLIAHEWIEPRGGSENVLEAIAQLYPDADLLTPWNNAPHRFPNRNVRELWLARSALRDKKAASVPFLTSAWRHAIPKDVNYDWVLASSHLFSHHIRADRANGETPKMVYAYTPARYVWTPEMDERGQGLAARAASVALRPLDRKRAAEATSIAGISRFVCDRIEFAWQRPASIIYPPVETAMLQSISDWRTMLSGEELALLESLPSNFVLGASRFIPYKRLDLVIDAAERAGMPVVIAGGGPGRSQLIAQADACSVPAIIVDDPSSALLYALYAVASVFVFPPVEDFGIMPIEASALGTPVVANSFGGSEETVLEGVSGIHFEHMDAVELAACITKALDISPESCRESSHRFSREQFDLNFAHWMELNVN